MYVVTKQKQAWADFEWDTLTEDGAPITETLSMKVKLVDADRYREFLAAFSGAGELDVREFIREVAIDWRGIIDEDKKAFEFNAENLDTVIQIPGFIVGWQLSYIRAWNGQAKAREKNFDSSPVDGQAGAPESQKTA